eukprot:gb/GEZJ01005810.1/.p1 GENE.gb/GEZJ01005810.1/~~gb/GEZJ01005810.1/.p1  ORF type:complete len:108 (-),score=7.61 gb/GEZJ01005810.1/:70-393(-)
MIVGCLLKLGRTFSCNPTGFRANVHSSGFLDTTYGPVLTMEAALGLMRLSERSKAISYTKALSKAAEKQRRETIERERVVLRDAIMIALMLCVAQGCMESRSSCRGR